MMILPIHELNTNLYKFAPNELKFVSKYYFSMRKLSLNNIKHNHLYFILVNILHDSVDKIKVLNLSNYNSICRFTDNIALMYINPQILFMNESIFHINHMSNLIELDVSNNKFIKDKNIQELVHLKKINIVNTNISDKSLCNFKYLEYITFGIDFETIVVASQEQIQINNVTLESLKTLIHLTEIIIHYGYDIEYYTSINNIKEI